MTRFVGEAVGQRKNIGNGGAYKSRAQKMEKFLETGSHDDIQRAQLLRENQRLQELPEFDPNHRSFVFLEVAIAGKSLGACQSLGRFGSSSTWESDLHTVRHR